MNINIQSVHFKADQSLEQFITKKVEKLGKHLDSIIGCDVTLKLESPEKPNNKIVDIRLKIKGNDLIASKQCNTFEEATDLAADALKKQIDKSKDFPKPKGKPDLSQQTETAD